MKELIKVNQVEINKELVQAVSARELHKILGVKDQFTHWAKRYTKKFVKNQDFSGMRLKQVVHGNRYVPGMN